MSSYGTRMVFPFVLIPMLFGGSTATRMIYLVILNLNINLTLQHIIYNDIFQKLIIIAQ